MDAPVVHFEDLFLGADDQRLVDTHFAELVLDDGDALAVVSLRIRLSRVVLPEPRNPVRTVTGTELIRLLRASMMQHACDGS